jgi:methyl-accepting chemotaxis protein
MFGVLTAALLFVALNGNISRNGLIRDSNAMRENYLGQLQMLTDVNVTTGNLFLSYRTYYLEYPNMARMQTRANEINNRTNIILTDLQGYLDTLKARNAAPQEIINVEAAIAKIQNEVVPLNSRLRELMQSNQIEEAHELIISDEMRIIRSSLQDDLIAVIYSDCLTQTNFYLDESVKTMRGQNMQILIGVSGALVLLVVLCVLVIRSIIVPIKRLSDISENVANGYLNVNIDSSANDEAGHLAKGFAHMVYVIDKLVNELVRMGNAIECDGDLEARVDINQFAGVYRDVADTVNKMMDGQSRDILEMLGCLEEYGNGNFDATARKLPGKKIVMNHAMDKMRDNLKSVSGDVDKLVSAAIDGNLSARADVVKYSGDWINLMNGLNRLLEVISAPLNESAEVLNHVSNGMFDRKMVGDYKGDYLKIKIAMNTTVSNINSYIDEISQALTQFSQNDLTAKISREYVGSFAIIKDALNNIGDTLSSVIGNITSSAENVASGARSISDSSMQLATGASEQASSIEELNATVFVINESTIKNSENAEHAKNLSDNSKVNAANGDENMKQMLSAMQGITDSSQKITNIIKVIEDIAFQTNLLALNAAVEAARAGEHGKGFAVVAEEVRTLASRSQAAAKETAGLIENSASKVNDGTKIAAATADALRTIVDDIDKTSSIIIDIAQSSNEQSEAINQITQGLSQITNVVQNNSATSQESASASEQLSGQAELLQNMVREFKLR